MNLALQITKASCFMAIAVGVCIVARDLDRNLRDVGLLLQHSDQLVQQETKEIHSTTQNVNAILLQIGIASDEARQAATEQRTYWNKTALQTEKTVTALRQLIDRTDRQLNDGTLPQLTSAVIDLDKNSTESLNAITQAGNTLNQQLSDPHIAHAFAEADVSLAEIAESTKHVDQATADVAATTTYYRKKLTTPETLVVRIGKTVLGLAAQLGSVFAGFVK